jgi:glucokinase
VHPESALARLRAEGKPVLSAHVVDAALDGDESAARMVEVWGQRIGIGVANAIHTFDPEEVVIGGDAARAGALLLEPARRVALEYVLPGLGAHATIRLARHGGHAGLLGAALLARFELES